MEGGRIKKGDGRKERKGREERMRSQKEGKTRERMGEERGRWGGSWVGEN